MVDAPNLDLSRWGPAGVMLAAGGLSGFLGFVAGLPYGSEVVGAVVGAAVGLVAGSIWYRLFVPRLRSGRMRHPGSIGGVYGTAVGVTATLLLHASLFAVSRKLNGNWLFTGVLCGAISGFVLGEICARVADRIVTAEITKNAQ